MNRNLCRFLLVSFLAVLTARPATALAQEANPWIGRRVLNIAHRGGRREAPEHTLYAYKTALPKLVTVLEIDVHLSADGVLVVHHDTTVDRVTNGTGDISTMTLAELKALDNAYRYSSVCEGNCNNQPPENYDFRGVATGEVAPPPGFQASDFQITTMREVLETFPNVLLSIEIKREVPDSVPAAERLADLLTEFGRFSDVMIASFDDATTAAFKARAPLIHTTPGLAETLAFAAGPVPLPNHIAFQVPRTFNGLSVPPLLIDPAHANDLAVYFFINGSEEIPSVYNELIDLGADGIITDRPTDFQAVIDARGVGYIYEKPLAVTRASVNGRGRVKFLSEAPTRIPIAAPWDVAGGLTVQLNGGELMDPLTAGTWKRIGKPGAHRGYRYFNRDAPAGGACKVVVVRPRRVRGLCEDKGSIPDPLAAGSNGDFAFELNFGVDRYCAAASAPHSTERSGALIKVRDSLPPSDCATSINASRATVDVR